MLRANSAAVAARYRLTKRALYAASVHVGSPATERCLDRAGGQWVRAAPL
jgi:hypothetical protein